MDLYEKEAFADSIPICHKHVKGVCSFGNWCKYKHIDGDELLMITDGNSSTVPCKFLTESNGCAMYTPHRVKNNPFKIRLESCDADRGYNHFYKPKYVCEKYFYGSSLDSEDNSLCTNGSRCPYLHIPWKNFARNMFCSKNDPDKKLCMEFLVQMTFNSVYKEMKEEYDNIISAHQRSLAVYRSMYLPKCIKCYLPPYKYKLLRPKVFTTYVLDKLKLCHDLSFIVNEYMYEDHAIKPDGSHDCIFMSNRTNDNKAVGNISSIEMLTLSNLFIHGPRIVSYIPKYYINLIKRRDYAEVESVNGPDIEKYSVTTRNTIWSELLK